MSKVCLNMIVKNEAKVITRCLESVKDFISCLYIMDTGSTDDTILLISAWCSARDIKGEIVTGEFIDFASARNRALQGALDSALDFTHLLFLDAGMEVTWPATSHPFGTNMGYPSGFHFTMNQSYANLTYANSRLVSRELPMKWKGVCHEYLECAQPALLLNGPLIICHSDGGNQSGQMERYRDLLEAGVKAEPENSRYVFYLAQSYFDLGDYFRAANQYFKRIRMGGWDEEVWYAKLRYAISESKSPHHSRDSVIRLFMEAYYDRPHRIEPLYYLGEYLKKSKTVTGIFPVPSDTLFVERGLYAD